MSKKSNSTVPVVNPCEFVHIVQNIDDLTNLIPPNKPFVQLIESENDIIAKTIVSIPSGRKGEPRGNRNSDQHRRYSELDNIKNSNSTKLRILQECIEFNEQNYDNSYGFVLHKDGEEIGHAYISGYSIKDKNLINNCNDDSEEKIIDLIPLAHLAEINNIYYLKGIIKVPYGHNFRGVNKYIDDNEAIVELNFKTGSSRKKPYYITFNFVFTGNIQNFTINIFKDEKFYPEEEKTMVGEQDADERA